MFVWFFAVKPVDSPQSTGSESNSSTSIHRTSETIVGNVIKSEPPPVTDEEVATASDALPPQKNRASLSLSSQLPKAASPTTQKTIRPKIAPSTASSSGCQAKDSPFVRVTRKSSRELALKIDSAPSNSIAANPVTKTIANDKTDAMAQSQNTPKPNGRERNSNDSFKCKQCDYSTEWKCTFVRHLRVHNDSTIELDRLKCEHCTPVQQKTYTRLKRRRVVKANENTN